MSRVHIVTDAVAIISENRALCWWPLRLLYKAHGETKETVNQRVESWGTINSFSNLRMIFNAGGNKHNSELPYSVRSYKMERVN